jgi:hypothetical protein
VCHSKPVQLHFFFLSQSESLKKKVYIIIISSPSFLISISVRINLYLYVSYMHDAYKICIVFYRMLSVEYAILQKIILDEIEMLNNKILFLI